MPHRFSILIVEDDDDAQQNMEDIIGLDGYTTLTAAHCSAAVEAVRSRHFDAIVIDWRLPDGNGSELIPIIKRALPDSPVVVVTGVREFDAAVMALRNGAYDFLTKPINPDAFRALLGRLVERKQHLAEIESAQLRLVASERLAAVGQMVAGLAHESRNALQRSHACLAELSLDLTGMPESLALVHKVQNALDDLHGLLEEVRAYSAPLSLDPRDCELRTLVEKSWQNLLEAGANNDAQNRRFELVCEEGFPTVVRVDPGKIQQVLRNLLENALFASRERLQVFLGRAEVRIPGALTPEAIQIAVCDDGPGVPDEQREEVFTPFFTTKTKGTGLGLAISQRIVEAHGGQIQIGDSDLGGARFVVLL